MHLYFDTSILLAELDICSSMTFAELLADFKTIYSDEDSLIYAYDLDEHGLSVLIRLAHLVNYCSI